MPVPVLSIAQMRQWEAATWATGRSVAEVIARVGGQLARRVRALTREGDHVLVLSGPGHNGQDAAAIAPHLADRRIETLELGDPAARQPELEAALEQRPALVVDGLFGIGLKQPLTAAWAAFVGTVNRAGRPVLAVDVPSGLNADTGEAVGAAIQAQWTLTVGAPKTGLLATQAAPFVGRLEVMADVGLVPCPVSGDLQWTVPADFRDYPPPRPADGHKGTFGHLIILAGSLGFHGAAVLAARGAQRARPGLISVFTPEAVYLPIAAQLQAVMVHPWQPATRWPENATAMVIGPGLAAAELPDELSHAAQWCWCEARFPILCDASALDWLRHTEASSPGQRILTPHPGEAARLLRASTAEVEADRCGALRELARGYGAEWVVLKGRHTAIGGREGPVFINSSGNPGLAQGGSGDALAGYLGGLLAQPALQPDLLTALRFGVWQHGATADALASRRPNWTVEELVDGLGEVVAD
jgi:NAD(P)H-hydrate epimerase